MKISIIGEKGRAAAWEKHLRKLSIVKEVIFTSSIEENGDVDAVLLINDSKNNLEHLYKSVIAGNHTFLISKLPVDVDMLEKIYHASEEAEVNVQFSHWPTLSESVQWIMQHVEKPELIQISKETIPANHRIIDIEDFNYDWIDEVALIVKWLGGNIHRYEIKPSLLGEIFTGFSASLRFENASLASLHFLAASDKDSHQRLFSNAHSMINFDVIKQKVRFHQLNDLNRLSLQEKKFDPSDTAERAVTLFIKSIQMKQWPPFSPYDALQTAKAVKKIKTLIGLKE